MRLGMFLHTAHMVDIWSAMTTPADAPACPTQSQGVVGALNALVVRDRVLNIVNGSWLWWVAVVGIAG